MELSRRNFIAALADDFRYGFNDKEKDDEIKGDGNSVLNDKFKVGLSAEKLLLDKGGFGKDQSLEGVCKKDFTKVKKGDIIVLFDQSGMVIHTFVYLGKNKVSSKNGDLDVNEFKDGKGKKYKKSDASIDDVVKFYSDQDKKSGGTGELRKGYFTPVDNKVEHTIIKYESDGKTETTTTYDLPSNGTVRKRVKKEKI